MLTENGREGERKVNPTKKKKREQGRKRRIEKTNGALQIRPRSQKAKSMAKIRKKIQIDAIRVWSNMPIDHKSVNE